MKATVKIARPKFYDYFLVERATTRICSVDGCEKAGTNVGGHYSVRGRRVRVWVCSDHRVGNPNKELPVPELIQAGLDLEDRYIEEANRKARYNPIDQDHNVSVKAFAPTGHGTPVRGDRVAQWRWGA